MKDPNRLENQSNDDWLYRHAGVWIPLALVVTVLLVILWAATAQPGDSGSGECTTRSLTGECLP